MKLVHRGPCFILFLLSMPTVHAAEQAPPIPKVSEQQITAQVQASQQDHLAKHLLKLSQSFSLRRCRRALPGLP